jgi:DNA-binding helix-hairpin-helix protein with protein kinase domain
VYAIKGGRLAAKIMANGSQVRQESLRNQLMHVRRLPLNDLALAKPLETLRPPHTGYIMELLTGMAPIKSLFTPKRGEFPSVEWYLGSGGLQRRLLLLGRAANVLAQLHGKGLVYSDPSPSNIFVSMSSDAHEVWFIDTDNLQYDSTPQNRHCSVYTPGFGAPELVAGTSGVTTLTDAFAFAVLAFQVITLAHPFIGDIVNEQEPELEEQAFAGILPWIDDPDDDQNRASFGIPREWVLSPRLIKTFSLTFGKGRYEPTARPGISEWAERLFAAADANIKCIKCSGTYYINNTVCPWCNCARPSFATASFHLWDPGISAKGGILTKPQGDIYRRILVGRGAISENMTFVITRRLAFGNSNGPINTPVMSLMLVGDHIKLRSLDGKVYRLCSPTGSQETEVGESEKSIKLEERQLSWILHFGDKETLHRVVFFEIHRGEGA